VAGQTIAAIGFGAIGLAVGSFIGLLSIRLPEGRSWIWGRSSCGDCGRSLPMVELVPLVSWALAGGRCRRCAAPIPSRYPLLEMACALIGIWAALNTRTEPAWLTAVFGWWVLLIAVIDAEHFWLPRALTLPLLGAGLAVHLTFARESWADSAIGAGAGWAGLAAIAWLFKSVHGKSGLGGGDPPMLGAIGAWVGWRELPLVVLTASLAGLAVAVARGRLKADARLPFGSLLALGGWLTWLYAAPPQPALALVKADPNLAVWLAIQSERAVRTHAGRAANQTSGEEWQCRMTG
jgi:leader peptidase (prepilin peptidase)/N-methyltransferase